MEPDTHEAAEKTSIAGLLRVVRRHPILILLFVVIVPLAAYASTKRSPAAYEATTQVLIGQQDPGGLINGIAAPAQTPEDAARFANTSAEIARSNVVAQQAASLSKVKGLSAAGLLAQTTVTPAAAADVLQIVAKTSDGAASMAIANAYATAFVAERTRLDISALVEARAEATKQIDALAKSGDTTSALVTGLKAKEQQLATIQTLYTNRATVLVHATNATDVRPKPTQRTAIGLILGIILGLVAAIIWEALDTRVRSSSETGRALGVRVLGRIPSSTRRLRKSGGLAMLDEPMGTQAETIRFLRSNIENLRLGNAPLSLLVSGPRQGEGKSTIAANLAVALAQSGNRVALLDGDPRRPSIAGLFGAPDSVGIEEVARGAVDLEEALVRVKVGAWEDIAGGELRILTGRSRVALSSERLVFGRAIADLRADCDFVIVDGPPLLLGGDALSLTSLVEGLMLVCRVDRLRRGGVDELAQALPSVPTNVLGVVCTGATDLGPSYGPYQPRAPRGRRTPSLLAPKTWIRSR